MSSLVQSDRYHQAFTHVFPEDVSAEQLIAQYQPLLRSVAKRYQATCGYDEAYQEACVSLLESWNVYDPNRGPFPAFASAKVRGDVRTAMRRIWRFQDRTAFGPASTDEDDSFDGGLETLLARDGQWYQDNEDVIGLGIIVAEMMAVAGLSDREQYWLSAFLAGYKPEEMARHLGVSRETVKTWRKRALDKLRRAAALLKIVGPFGI